MSGEGLSRSQSERVKKEVKTPVKDESKQRESPFLALKNKLHSVSSTLVASVSITSPSSASDDPEQAIKNNQLSTKKKTKSKHRRHRPDSKTVKIETILMDYEVHDGDTIMSIAAKFDTTPSELCSINRLFSRHLFPSQKLKVPDKSATAAQQTSEIKGEATEENNSSGSEETESDDEAFVVDEKDESLMKESHEEEENDIHARQYIKVEVKFVTEREGTIGGCLLVTPNIFMFSPWCSDPVVQEYGLDQFTVEFPISRIQSIAMYNNPSVMFFDRRQRTKSDCLVAQSVSDQKPSTESVEDTIPETRKSTSVSLPDDCNAPSPCTTAAPPSSVLQSEVAEEKPSTTTTTTTIQTNEVVEATTVEGMTASDVVFLSLDDRIESVLSTRSSLLTNSVSGNRRHIFSSLPFYICVRVPCTFRSTKCSTMVRDEYWFMIPQTEGQSLCEFLMHSGVPSYGTDDADESSKSAMQRRSVSFVHSSTRSHNHPQSIRTAAQLSEADKRHRFKLRQESMTWELLNVEDCLGINVHDADPENLPLPDLSEDSCILTEEKIRELLLHLPPGAEGCNWVLLYSTWRDGCSLKTLYRQSQQCEKPCILIIQNEEENVFGALLSDKIKISDLFYGRGETYVFRWNPHFQKFRWSGENRFFIKGSMDTLTIGCADGQCALWLDDRLYRGRSQACKTFNSPTLPADEREDFLIHNLEVWSFN